MTLDIFWSVHHQIRNKLVIPPDKVEKKWPYTAMVKTMVDIWQSIIDV
jgi:hypothetical protein